MNLKTHPVFAPASRPVSLSTIGHGLRWRVGFWFLLLVICTFSSSQAAVWTWSGAGGANANWTDSANWSPAGIPGNGDTVIFPSGRPNEVNTNNFGDLVLNQIQFVGSGSGYNIRGNAFTLTNSIWATNASGANVIEPNIILSTATITMVVSNGAGLNLEGNLSGSVGVTKTGLGTLYYQGPSDNTYTGPTTVLAGNLELNVGGFNAFEGPLVIGDDSGTFNPVVQDLQGEELPANVPITINLFGTLDLNGYSETIGTNVTTDGATITTGTGTLSLSPNCTFAVSGGWSTDFYGHLNTGSGTLTLAGIDLANINFFANVAGSANIVQNYMETDWIGTNTYAGNYTLNGEGYLELASPQALGNSTNNLIVNDQCFVAVSGDFNLTNQSVTLNGTNDFYQIYANGPGTFSTWTVNITNNSGVTVDVPATCTLNLNGTISGPGGLTKIDGGPLTLSGNGYNNYAGPTTVGGGTLLLDKSDFAIAIPSPLILGTNTTVRLLDNFQIDSFTTPVTMYDGSLLDLNGFTEAFGPLTLQGAQLAGDGGSFYLSTNITVNASTVAQSVISGVGEIYGSIITITNAGHNYSPDLVISAVLDSGGATNGLIKAGEGEVSLAGNNAFTGPVTVNGGNLWAQTATALGNASTPATVNSGGSLFLDGNGLDFGLKPLVLSGSGYSLGALSCTGSNSWEGNITLNGDSTIYETAGSSLTLSGDISGLGNLIKSGPGTNNLTGTGANGFDGQTFVNAGTMNLDKTGYSIGLGALNIGTGTGGAASVIVREFNDLQIDASSVIINSDGFLDLNGHNDFIGPAVTLYGGANIQNTSPATLTLVDSTVLAVTGPSSISGNLNVGETNTTCTWLVTGSLLLNGSVVGAANIQDSGGGTTTLVASNSFTGLFVLQQGHLQAENNYALGATNGGLIVSNTATLELVGSIGVTNKSLTLNGPGISSGWGALDVEAGTNIWAGPIVLNANSTFDAWNGSAALHINGPISGVGGPEVFGFGTHYYDGSASNSFAGVTTVDQNTTLLLDRSISYSVVPNNVIVSGTLRVASFMQIGYPSDMLINSGGVFDLGSFYQSVNTLHGSGQVTVGLDGYLFVGVANGSSEFDGVMSGTGFPGGYTLDKIGTGAFTLAGNNTYQNETLVGAGTLVVNGSQPQSPVVVQPLATLTGTGTVGTILGGGKVAPGHNLGILNSSNVTFNASGSFSVYLNRTNTGTGYSQLNVTGTVSLASASLQVLPETVGAVNSRYFIINNDSTDPVVGIFNGLPEGATVVANNGAKFTISYQGGTGNDVVLTQISLPTPPLATGIQQLTTGTIQLDGSGLTNLTYTVWANTNLATTNWVDIGTVAAPANTNAFQFIDPNAAEYRQRFYRFSWP